jgi:DnaJ-class molecular chaperone
MAEISINVRNVKEYFLLRRSNMTTMLMGAGHDDDKDIRPDCDSCGGSGSIDIGDCEDGVTDTCPACDGTGKGPEDGIDEFVPERDAFTPND